MSTSASGVVRNKDDKSGMAGLRVVLDDISQQYDVRLNEQEDPNTHQKKKDLTGTDGTFNLTYAADALRSSGDPAGMSRQLRLRIMLGQIILAEKIQFDSRADDHLTFAAIELPRGEDTCRFATLRGGTASRFSTGNAIRWLVDNEDAWSHTADLIQQATILDVMQLGIDIDKYHADVELERPKVILRFDPKKPLFDPNKPLVDASSNLTDATNPRLIDASDQRIERMILERFQEGIRVPKKGIDIRIQIPHMTFALEGSLIGGGLALGTGILLLLPLQLCTLAKVLLWSGLVVGLGLLIADLAAPSAIGDFDEDKVEEWFKTAIGDLHSAGETIPNQVRVHELRLRSMFVTHAKIVIDRVPVEGDPTKSVGKRAVLLGSPFKQVYFDSFRLRDPIGKSLDVTKPERGGHEIDDPRRGGDASKGPIHDVSVAVRGPAVGYLQEVFDVHWNQAAPDDKLTSPVPNTPTFPKPVDGPPADSNEFITPLQVVRTLDRQFTAPDDKGESGILEAYLRAIHFATDFIYIENQYFKNDRVTDALIEALDEKPNLVVILLLNVNPDEPLLPRWQRQTIERLVNFVKNKDKVKDDDPLKNSKRFGVFSAWAHAKGDGQKKPRLVDHYLHTKTALIDNRWATSGSANLDDASHDFVDFARFAMNGDPVNSETNVVIYEDPPVQPSAVDALRRRLWAEHLGLQEDGHELDAPPAGKTWVEFWRTQADAKLALLKSNPNQPSPIRVLRWASVGFAGSHADHKDSKDYLKALFQDDDKLKKFTVLGKGDMPSIPFAYGKE